MFLLLLTAFLLSGCACSHAQLILKPDYPAESGRIVGGTTVTNRTQFAYQVSVRLKTVQNPVTGSHICGGSIISPRFVLTAAHCVITSCTSYYVASQYVIVAGDLNAVNATEETVYKNVSRIISNPDFNVQTIRYDMSVFELATPFDLNNVTLRAIPLAGFKPENNVDCVVAGWGHTQWQGVASAELLYVNLKILHDDICFASYNLDVFTFVQFREDHLCAGHTPGGMGSCQGDSGGALVCNGLQTGIVSFGIQCALAGIPSVYTNVAYFAPWLREVTGLQINGAPEVAVSVVFVLALGVLGNLV